MKLTSSQRDLAIYHQRESGRTLKSIAAEFGVSANTVRVNHHKVRYKIAIAERVSTWTQPWQDLFQIHPKTYATVQRYLQPWPNASRLTLESELEAGLIHPNIIRGVGKVGCHALYELFNYPEPEHPYISSTEAWRHSQFWIDGVGFVQIHNLGEPQPVAWWHNRFI